MPDILYEDARLIALDKPAGLATIPERFLPHCLQEEVQDYLGEKAFIVHRLDKDVSGVVLFAKDAAAHRHLSMAFEARAVDKHYVAVVHGQVGRQNGGINLPIRAFGSGRMGVDERKGKPSTTRYAVRQRRGDTTVLDVYPVTGRRHQIRVHLYHLGHPIVGDPLYGDTAAQAAYPRLFLHAHALTFEHPDGGRRTITAPLPDGFYKG